MPTDFRYMSDLANVLNTRQSKSFYIVVDMRGLTIPDSVKRSKADYPIYLDRRNQQGEVWLLKEPDQADHLLRFFAETKFSFFTTVNEDEFETWLDERLQTEQLRVIKAWLQKN